MDIAAVMGCRKSGLLLAKVSEKNLNIYLGAQRMDWQRRVC